MDGYGWIHYNSNNIGRRAVWAKAKKIKYQINPGLVTNNPVFTNPTDPVFNPKQTAINPKIVNQTKTVDMSVMPKTQMFLNTDKGTRGITKIIFSNAGQSVQVFGKSDSEA